MKYRTKKATRSEKINRYLKLTKLDLAIMLVDLGNCFEMLALELNKKRNVIKPTSRND